MAVTTFRMPVIISGRESSESIGTLLKGQGYSKVFLVTDVVLWEMGAIEKIVNSLRSEQLEFERYDELPSEPTTDFIREGKKRFYCC